MTCSVTKMAITYINLSLGDWCCFWHSENLTVVAVKEFKSCLAGVCSHLLGGIPCAYPHDSGIHSSSPGNPRIINPLKINPMIINPLNQSSFTLNGIFFILLHILVTCDYYFLPIPSHQHSCFPSMIMLTPFWTFQNVQICQFWSRNIKT